MREIKAIIDTNVFVGAIIGKSKIMKDIYTAFVNGDFTPVISLSMYEELLDVLARKKLRRYFDISQINHFKKMIDEDASFVIPTQKIDACRDTKDNIILEAAIAAKGTEFIVSCDNDLLCLKSFHNVLIVSPKEFLSRLKK